MMNKKDIAKRIVLAMPREYLLAMSPIRVQGLLATAVDIEEIADRIDFDRLITWALFADIYADRLISIYRRNNINVKNAPLIVSIGISEVYPDVENYWKPTSILEEVITLKGKMLLEPHLWPTVVNTSKMFFEALELEEVDYRLLMSLVRGFLALNGIYYTYEPTAIKNAYLLQLLIDIFPTGTSWKNIAARKLANARAPY